MRTRAAQRSVVLLVSVLAVSPAAPARAQAPDDSAPVAAAPVFKVGDEWKWSNGGQRRVIAVEGDLTVTPFTAHGCRGCRAYRDKHLTIVKIVDREGNIVVNDAIGYKLLDFPLRVGKVWDSSVMLVDPSAQVSRPYKDTFRVWAYEDVTTRAGTFKAFRIRHERERQHTVFGADAGRRWAETLWYSPAVKSLVKREGTTAPWGGDWELESYSLK